jgi:LPXTG-motif cell wall-anchored protein
MNKLITGAALAVLTVLSFGAPASATQEKEWVCHATGSQTNPFVLIKVPTHTPHLNVEHPNFHENDVAPEVIVVDDETFRFCPGPVGPEGPAGPPGPAGPEGPAGKDGEDGATGPEGPAGPAGEAGPQGEVGPAGPAGAAGQNGADGADGAAGPAGPTGAQGVAGNPGYSVCPDGSVVGMGVIPNCKPAVTIAEVGEAAAPANPAPVTELPRTGSEATGFLIAAGALALILGLGTRVILAVRK